MNQSQTKFPMSARALTELQLADWQFVVHQSTADTDPGEIEYANRQIAYLHRQLGIAGDEPDTHVRTLTHADEPAFVIPDHFDGLSKREHMATQLMAAMVANKGAWYNPMEPAIWAVEHADALINALNKK